MGHEAAGEVIAVGDGVTRVRAGDRVVLRSILPLWPLRPLPSTGSPTSASERTGLGMQLDGAYAERVVVPDATGRSRSRTGCPTRTPRSSSRWRSRCMPSRSRRSGPADAVAIVGAGPIGLLTLLAVRRRGAGPIIVTDRDPHRLAAGPRPRRRPRGRRVGRRSGRGRRCGDERPWGGRRARGRRDRADRRPVDRPRPARRHDHLGRQLGAGGPAADAAGRDPGADDPRGIRLRRRVRGARSTRSRRAGPTPIGSSSGSRRSRTARPCSATSPRGPCRR